MRVTFQFGMHKESVTLDETSMNGIAEAAAIFVTRCDSIRFPEHRLKRIQENVHLLRHNIESSNVLEIIRSESDIMEDCLIEIVLSESTPMEDLQISPHVMAVHSYKSPHFCDFCGEMLFGLVRQGLKCEGCGRNFHKRCAFKIPNNCSLSRRLGENNSVAALASLNLPVTGNKSWTGRPVWLEREYAGRVKVPHTFVVHSYTKPTICQYCKKLLHGLFRQGLQCKDCCFNVHRRCAKLVTSDCEGEAFEVSESVYDADYVIAEADVNRTVTNCRNSCDTAVDANEDWTSSGDTDTSEIDSQEVNDDPDNSENNQQKPPLSPSASSNIPLMRVIQSVKHTKGKGSTIIREGWMVHCTPSDPVRRRHFWRLDTKCITLFIDERTNRYFKEFQLSEITGLTHSKTEMKEQKSNHVFEMQMKSGQLILVGEDPCFGNDDMTNNKIVNSPDSGIGREQARHFELAIRNALMPVTPQVSSNENESSKDGQQEGSKSTVTAGRSFKSEKPGSDSMSSGQIADIGQLYEINPDELLGSGQFGVVYGAKSKSGMDVAIKVIDKQRFPTKQEAQLKNEVTILHNLHHPGVIILERMFETDERIYVVMEKMQGDMLEMILNSPRSRLSERVTKYLVTQILVALKYLHSKNVVHCDLKPENVLLSTNSVFPQIKLCDFGFARLIGEKSFRRSIVGTPAYLAPEVLKSKGYNRSIDVWSVGVVVYVSLSGTFPFNEDEEIHDQIQNAAFMYPPNPWKQISVDAIALINCLLQVKLRRRYSLDKCFTHKWLQDYKCWCDLRKLEEKLGLRFITYECEDSRWEEHRKNNNLPSWKELGWNSSE